MKVVRIYDFPADVKALVCVAVIACTLQAATTDAPPAEETVQTRLSAVRLAQLPDQADEAGYLLTIAARTEEWVNSAEAADDAASRAGFLVAAANLILAHQLEPACSRAILGIEPPGDSAHARAEAQRVIDRADALLARADETLKAAADSANDGGEPIRTAQQLEALQGFAEALRALLFPQSGPDADRRVRRAASRLSILLDDANPRVAAPAALLYTCLRSRETERDAALAVLDTVLSEPPRQALAHGFYSRLLRCRLLGQQGGHAAALALLLQIEERCDAWFNDQTQRADAIRTVGLVQVRVLDDWRSRLMEPAREAERQWCEARISSLIQERLTSDSATVLRLNLAVPLIADPPRPQPPATPLRKEG